MFAGSEWRLAAGALYTMLLVIACITDVRWRRIPNALVLVLALTGFAFSVAMEPWLPGLLRAFSGLVLGFSIWILFHVAGGMGAGDVARSRRSLAGCPCCRAGRWSAVARSADAAAKDA